MWFRNLTCLRFAKPFDLSADQLEKKLSDNAFAPLGKHSMISMGWEPALGRRTKAMVHAVGGCMLISLKVEEKILPAAVVRELLDERIEEIEEREARKVRGKEKTRLREDLVEELMPRAFSKSRTIRGYIDTNNQWLIIDSTTAKVIDTFTGRLREAIDTLPVEPLKITSSPAVVMTDWLSGGGLPEGYTAEGECELRDTGDEGGIVRCKGQDLAGDEIRTHIQAGKEVTRIALDWQQRLSFLLADDFTLRRLKFSDIVQEQLDDTDVDSAEAAADVEFTLMHAEIARLLPGLIAIFSTGEAGKS